MHVAAIPANPPYSLITFEYKAIGYVLCQRIVPPLVPLLGNCYASEDLSDFSKTFFLRRLGKIWVHLGMFVIFTGCRRLQILNSIADNTGRKCRGNLNFTALQEFELTFGMFLLLVGGLLEDPGYLLVALFSGLAGKLGVTVPRLRFARECRQ